jgi:hypothetical protein
MQGRRKKVSSWPSDAVLVRAVGDVVGATVEESLVPERIDHLWITLDAGIGHPIRLSINTFSRRSVAAGVDPRIRLGRLRDQWTDLPPRGVERFARFDYAEMETRGNVFYETLDRGELESLLLEAATGCRRLEVIGAPYHHCRLPGIHQIHSRRASKAVTQDLVGLDGALRFYFENHEATWWFFKFCGQP